MVQKRLPQVERGAEHIHRLPDPSPLLLEPDLELLPVCVHRPAQEAHLPQDRLDLAVALREGRLQSNHLLLEGRDLSKQAGAVCSVPQEAGPLCLPARGRGSSLAEPGAGRPKPLQRHAVALEQHG